MAPARRSPSAIISPMPLEPPVTSATLPLSEKSADGSIVDMGADSSSGGGEADAEGRRHVAAPGAVVGWAARNGARSRAGPWRSRRCWSPPPCCRWPPLRSPPPRRRPAPPSCRLLPGGRRPLGAPRPLLPPGRRRRRIHASCRSIRATRPRGPPTSGRASRASAVDPAEATPLLRTLARHPPALHGLGPLAAYLRSRSMVAAVDQILMGLRAAWLCRSEALWAELAAEARAFGLVDDDLRRVAEGPDAGWGPGTRPCSARWTRSTAIRS